MQQFYQWLFTTFDVHPKSTPGQQKAFHLSKPGILASFDFNLAAIQDFTASILYNLRWVTLEEHEEIAVESILPVSIRQKVISQG